MSNPITQGKIDVQRVKQSQAWFGSAGWKNRRDAGVTGSSIYRHQRAEEIDSLSRPAMHSH